MEFSAARLNRADHPIPCIFPGIRLLVSTVCSRNLRKWPNGPARSGQETSSLSARSSPEARPPTSTPCPGPPRSRQGGSPERCQCLSQAAGVAYCACQWPSQLTESGAKTVLRDHATGKSPAPAAARAIWDRSTPICQLLCAAIRFSFVFMAFEEE